MPKNFYPDNMVKKKKSSRIGSILSLILILVGIGLCVMLALLFSNLITVGSFSFLNNNEMKKNGYTIYAVSIYQSTNFSSSGSNAASQQDKGYAGYVYFDNGIFYVLASGYKEKSDADKVVEKLMSEGVNAKIVPIGVASTSISGSFSNQQQSTLSSALTSFSSSFDSLYDMSVSLDTKVSTENEIRNQLNSLLSQKKSLKKDFDSAFAQNKSQELLEISLSLGDVVDYIDATLSQSDTPLSSKLKYCYFQIIEENLNLKRALEN